MDSQKRRLPEALCQLAQTGYMTPDEDCFLPKVFFSLGMFTYVPLLGTLV
jgi:hypothetical protein